MDLRNYDRDFILEFINCYRDNPCLWQYNDPMYRNRKAKYRAYGKLIAILKTVEPKAGVDQVRKKLQSLRSSHRKERRKVRQSAAFSESGKTPIYVPKLWYYNELEFLNDQHYKMPADDHSTNVDEEDKLDDSDQYSETEQFEEKPIQCTDEVEERTTPFQQYSPASAWMHDPPSALTKDNASTGAVLELISRRLNQTEDQFDFVGKNVAIKLRQMSARQKLIAEKLINDVLFHGLLEQLTLESSFNVFEHAE